MWPLLPLLTAEAVSTGGDKTTLRSAFARDIRDVWRWHPSSVLLLRAASRLYDGVITKRKSEWDKELKRGRKRVWERKKERDRERNIQREADKARWSFRVILEVGTNASSNRTCTGLGWSLGLSVAKRRPHHTELLADQLGRNHLRRVPCNITTATRAQPTPPSPQPPPTYTFSPYPLKHINTFIQIYTYICMSPYTHIWYIFTPTSASMHIHVYTYL